MADRKRISGINPISKQSSRLSSARNNSMRHIRTNNTNKFDRRGKASSSRSDKVCSNEEQKPFYKCIAEEVLGKLRNSNYQKGMTYFDKKKECIELLDQCESSMPVITHVDEYGYDIAQHVVGKGDTELLEYIFKRGFDVALNKRKCSSLLQIACHQGSSKMINFLIDHGASVTHKSSKCFPNVKHYILVPRASSTVCDYHHVGCCKEERKELLTPLHGAVEADNLNVIKTILCHEKVDLNAFLNEAVVEFACHKGAVKCMPFLIEKFPSQINSIDTVGRTCIHFAFRSSEECGFAFLKAAKNYGLKPSTVNHMTDFMNPGTVLHYIFWLENCIRFMDILNLVIEAGFDTKHMKVVYQAGNTLLHILMLQMGKRIHASVIKSAMVTTQNTSVGSYEDVMKSLESEKEKHIFATLEFLINHGVNKNALASNGESMVHKLLHNCVYLNLAGFTTFSKLLPQIIKVLEYLFRIGLDLSVSAEYCSTPLNYLVHTISSFHADQIDRIWPDIWYLFTIFLKYGADPNATDRRGVSNVSILLTTLHRWLNYTINHPSEQPAMTRERDLPIRTLLHVQDVLTLFFQHELKPRQEILELCCKQVAILCNIKYSDEMFIEELKNLFKPFFLNGINPNTLRMITEGNRDYGVPCQLHAQFYLARSFIIHYNTGAMHHFFSIFTNTLHRENLNSLILAMCTILLENFDTNNQSELISCNSIDEMMAIKQTVRPLKCLSRICIANSLSWKIDERKRLLPLPKLLQDYLCQF